MDLAEQIKDIARVHGEMVQHGMAARDMHYHPALLHLERVYREALKDPKFCAPTTLHVAIESAIALLPDRKIGDAL